MSRSRASVGFSPTRWNGARKMPNFMPLWVMPGSVPECHAPSAGFAGAILLCGLRVWGESAGGLARVHREHLAGDVAGRRTAQERGGRRDVGGRRHALERRALEHGLAHGLGRDAAHAGLTLDDA